MGMYITVEVANEVLETLWKVMDTEWSGAQEARKKCEELIENNTIQIAGNPKSEKKIADYINKATNGAWPDYEEYIRKQNK